MLYFDRIRVNSVRISVINQTRVHSCYRVIFSPSIASFSFSPYTLNVSVVKAESRSVGASKEARGHDEVMEVMEVMEMER